MEIISRQKQGLMSRAKEILLDEAAKHPNFGLLTGTMPCILTAMETFAKEQCLLFIKHIAKQQYDFSAYDGLSDEAAEEMYNEFKNP